MVENLVWFAISTLLLVGPAARLILKPIQSRLTVGLLAFFVANAAFYAWVFAPWELWGFWSRRIVMVIVALSLGFAIFRFVKASSKRPSLFPLLGGLTLGALGLYFAVQNVFSWGAMSTDVEPIALASPIKDTAYSVVQGGAAPPMQTGHAGVVSQRFGLDLIAINDGLSGYSPYLVVEDFRNSETWGLPIYAPCEGEVVWARDGVEDSEEHDLERPAGNVVGIDCMGATVMLAHLKQGTVAVAEGDTVTTGQLLGEIGMSGRSFGPHLHMHAERGPLKRDFSDNEAVPMLIDGRFLTLSQLVEPES